MDELNVKRKPYSYEKILYESLGMFYNMISDDEIRHNIDLLCLSLLRKIKGKSDTKKKIIGDSIKTFIGVFLDKYSEYMDYPYEHAISGKETSMIKNVIKKLSSKGMSCKDYVIWYFDDFLPNQRKTYAPSINFLVSNSMVDQFVIENKELMEEKKSKKNKEMREQSVLSMARTVYRSTKDNRIKQAIEDYKNEMLSLRELEKLIIELKKRINEDE